MSLLIGSRSRGGAVSRAEKQALMLERRQAELKQAALAAKKDGDLELARNYLRQAKGITPLIEASKSGLPVDLSSIPISPNAKTQLNTSGLVDASSDDSFTLVSSVDCLEEASGTDQQIYENLEKQLIKQTKVIQLFCKFSTPRRYPGHTDPQYKIPGIKFCSTTTKLLCLNNFLIQNFNSNNYDLEN